MKKIVKLLFVFLLSFVFIPMVHAEDLPREGVTYFMYYPDGSNSATLNFEEASDPEEKLIFSGTTDSNGKINLCDWDSEGQLRIVQHVPDGYTTSTKELKVDLSKDNSANFINYRGLDNPKTGRSLLILFGVAGVVITTILVSRKNKKSLLVIPVVLGIFAVTQVKADTCFCVQVKDGNGKALSNVKVDIYAKPNYVEGVPAIKFDANGGKFFDGLDYFYLELPHNECTTEEFMESLEDDYKNLVYSLNLAYRDGYRYSGLLLNDTDMTDSETLFKNGDVIKIKWHEDGTAETIEVYGNGGTYTFFGEEFDKTSIYNIGDNITIQNKLRAINEFLDNGNKKFIGYDTTASCSSFTENGLVSGTGRGIVPRIDSKLYACWSELPDGIYINDEVFTGKPNTCFKESNFEDETSSDFSLIGTKGGRIYIGDIDLDDIYFTTLFFDNADFIYQFYGEFDGEGSSNIQGRAPSNLSPFAKAENIKKVEVVKDGRVIVTLEEDDFEEEDGKFYILNDDKRPILLDYLAELDENDCFGV